VEVEPQLIEAYVATGKVRIVARHLLQLGENSQLAAEAAECAGDQGLFWEMRTAIYERQSDLYTTNDVRGGLQFIAGEVGADQQAFAACLQDGTHRAAVEADYRAAQEAGIRSRPVFDINGERIIGGRQFADFQAVIDAKAP
jgi:protein-disulfide isomerase